MTPVISPRGCVNLAKSPSRVRCLDEHGVEPRGGDGGEHEPGRAAHQVPPPAPHDARNLSDLARGGHRQGQRLEKMT